MHITDLPTRSARYPRKRERSARRALPAFLWLGVAIFALGAAGDIAHHTIGSLLPNGLEQLLGPEAVNAHIVTLIGMVVIMAGVIRFGMRQPKKRGGKEIEATSSKEM